MKTRKAPPYRLTFVPEETPQAALTTPRKHRVAIVRQEGSNGDREMAASFHMSGFEAWDVHMSDLLEGRVSLDQFRGAAFVGGFSYADTLDSSKGWAASVLFSPALKACSFFERQHQLPAPTHLLQASQGSSCWVVVVVFSGEENLKRS